ncbi:hypothetical protein [Cellvibrio sp. QJXJ]|uniref:hypothetical protein n=1 Tax=Cellvibrio sp. QJXJ TaxID=2964606 RepID=UPI0021C2D456|nr:hypothetical protein [Cellvibrio sp. QJXJ]UUA75159.1 hypothetical protein NNX04_22135 [Cellvibrio sp. QJXJ]
MKKINNNKPSHNRALEVILITVFCGAAFYTLVFTNMGWADKSQLASVLVVIATLVRPVLIKLS